MANVKVKSYVSPTLVLLAFDWDEGATKPDFLGFAIRKTMDGKSHWLPNRIGFKGPAPKGGDIDSNKAPIQKFQWWDARIDDADRGKTVTYEVIPVSGTWSKPTLLMKKAKSVAVKLPKPVQGHIGSYFNRAVVSSQAFSKEFPAPITGPKWTKATAWLANGMQYAVPAFLATPRNIAGAIYHLTDKEWIIPALLKRHQNKTRLVYDSHKKDTANQYALGVLPGHAALFPRTKTNIMHDKFLVRVDGGHPGAVLTGSANFTTEGICAQANVIHTFESPELAALYAARAGLLEGDPTLKKTAASSGWSKAITVDNAKVRVFFPPEPTGQRKSIDAVVEAVKKARSSVLFCIFSPTDAALRNAIFAAANSGKTMFGLVNTIDSTTPGGSGPTNAAKLAQVEIYHRSKTNKDVFAHSLYPHSGGPKGFWWERATLPGAASKWPVYIHHKFVLIDGETDSPTIYTGSANMSKNATNNNDENLLEIKGSARLAKMYFAEFMRLYEHYRARAIWDRYMKGKVDTYQLVKNRTWADKYYVPGTPEFKSRRDMV